MLGLLLLKAGRKAEAVPWLVQCRPDEPGFADARLRLAALELDARRPEAAKAALLQALSAAPQLRAQVDSDPRLASLLAH